MLSTKSTFSGFFRYFFDLIFGHTTGTYFFFLLDTHHSFENERSDVTEAPDEHDHELHGPQELKWHQILKLGKMTMIYVVLKHGISYQLKMPTIQNSCRFYAVLVLETFCGLRNPGGSLITMSSLRPFSPYHSHDSWRLKQRCWWDKYAWRILTYNSFVP